MRVNIWNTETGRGGKVHTGTLSEPEPKWASIQGNRNGVCIILEAPDGKSIRVTFTNDEAREIAAAVPVEAN